MDWACWQSLLECGIWCAGRQSRGFENITGILFSKRLRALLSRVPTVPCDPESVKVFLVILAILILAGSIFADYKWRRWMAARRAEHRDRD